MWRHRHRAVDILLAATCVLAGTWEGLQSGLFNGSPIVDRRAPLAVGVLLGVLTGLAALVRRNRPRLLHGCALLLWCVTSAYPPLLIAQFTIGAHLRSTRQQVVLTTVMLAAVSGPLWRVSGGDGSVPLSFVLCVAPVLLGLYLASRREVMANLAERARRNEREERLRIDQARAEERAQIARDMHDVVTHRVSLMVLHATAIESAQGRDAVAIAGRIQDIGRDALDELRTLVGVLRDDAPAPLRPQPGLADLDELVSSSRALGLTIDLVVERSAEDGLRPSLLVEHAVYRVVQEALTNVHKHAPGARATVTVRPAEDGLRVTVRDSGGTLAPAVPAASGGHGLLGLSERIRLIGGTLHTDRLPEGGFEVCAQLPVVRLAEEPQR
ncbi:sensor histidine kinase [Micromonospora sp. NPDC003197]